MIPFITKPIMRGEDFLFQPSKEVKGHRESKSVENVADTTEYFNLEEYKLFEGIEEIRDERGSRDSSDFTQSIPWGGEPLSLVEKDDHQIESIKNKQQYLLYLAQRNR